MPEFYCLTCDRTTTDDTCRDCGEETEELCPVCNEILDNCECEEPANETHFQSFAYPAWTETA